MARRQHLTLTFVLVLAAFFTLSYFFSGPSRSTVPKFDDDLAEPLKDAPRSEFAADLRLPPRGTTWWKVHRPKAGECDAQG
ncbi:hypothetical protein NM208_g15049 [Fusarium decemcellulare]|uniref:Uncharacterized protein n=1 Tax=Fusarium decemcellulare TaxID=57161 RepID=A0ACC1RFZ5_9HYPO|nr:hypothetical protein NM208_g15049 [Fusarium decemcellulare]